MPRTQVHSQPVEAPFDHSPSPPLVRARVDGKFLDCGGVRFRVKGVTYGTFSPRARRDQFLPLPQVEDDFSTMVRHGINTVRTYTVPDPDILDCAARHGLRLMIGVPWSQHRAFLDDPRERREIRRAICDDVRRLGQHPAALLFALGNEIPAAVVRWHGPEAVAAFLRQLYDAAKDAAPESLFTYVNFPPTEYLDIPFFDVCAFNVYLHRRDDLRAYLTHLQHVAGHKPLLLAEAGADSLREGTDGQAALIRMQLETAFAAGACGAVAFSWTDEWWRGGYEVEDWAFGLVTADRRSKPALHAVSAVYRRPDPHVDRGSRQPAVSVVVCAYNAASTIGGCLESLDRLRYPDLEVIVVNDGSTDETGRIVRRFPAVRLIEIANGGLAAARNVGAAAARGDIVVYTDADVRVDPDWLTYLVRAFDDAAVGAAGGPNVVPPDDPFVSQCVARAPGGPIHVMLDDEVAEHVPGCNLAIRRSALAAIGGFNPVFRQAGDDVDICWRLQANGWKVAFVPAALVWHHHRATVGAYWRQQVGYGEGEVWLRPCHPERFVGLRPFWRGRIYGSLPLLRTLTVARVHAGVWGTAAFPTVYRADPHPLVHLPHSIGWQLGSVLMMAAGLIAPALLGPALARALLSLGALGLATTVGRCLRFSLATDIDGCSPSGASGRSRWRPRALIAALHFLQPLGRGYGQLRGRLRPPRTGPRANEVRRVMPVWIPARLLWRGFEQRFWSETAVTATEVLERVVSRLRGAVPAPVEVDAGWWTGRDVSVPVGRLTRIDLRVLVEDHGAGRCLVRTSTRLRGVEWFAAVAALAAGLALYGLATPGVLVETVAAAALLWSAWHLLAASRVGAVIGDAVHEVARRGGLHALTPAPLVPRPARPAAAAAGRKDALS